MFPIERGKGITWDSVKEKRIKMERKWKQAKLRGIKDWESFREKRDGESRR